MICHEVGFVHVESSSQYRNVEGAEESGRTHKNKIAAGNLHTGIVIGGVVEVFHRQILFTQYGGDSFARCLLLVRGQPIGEHIGNSQGRHALGIMHLAQNIAHDQVLVPFVRLLRKGKKIIDESGKLPLVNESFLKHILVDTQVIAITAVNAVVNRLNIRLICAKYVGVVGVIGLSLQQVSADFLHHAAERHSAGFERLQSVGKRVGTEKGKANALYQDVDKLIPKHRVFLQQ